VYKLTSWQRHCKLHDADVVHSILSGCHGFMRRARLADDCSGRGFLYTVKSKQLQPQHDMPGPIVVLPSRPH